MAPEWAKIIVDLAQFTILGVIGIHQWLVTRDRVRTSQLQEIEERLIRIEAHEAQAPTSINCSLHADRLTRIEEAARHMPDRNEIASIYQSVNPMREHLAAVRADIAAVKDTQVGLRVGLAAITESLLRRDEDAR